MWVRLPVSHGRTLSDGGPGGGQAHEVVVQQALPLGEPAAQHVVVLPGHLLLHILRHHWGGRLFARFCSKKRKGENPFPPLPSVIDWEPNVKQQSTVSGRRALVVNSNVFDPMLSVLLGGVSIGRLRRIECQYGGFAGYPHPAPCVCVLRWLLRDTRHKKMPGINDCWWHSDLSTN